MPAKLLSEALAHLHKPEKERLLSSPLESLLLLYNDTTSIESLQRGNYCPPSHHQPQRKREEKSDYAIVQGHLIHQSCNVIQENPAKPTRPKGRHYQSLMLALYHGTKVYIYADLIAQKPRGKKRQERIFVTNQQQKNPMGLAMPNAWPEVTSWPQITSTLHSPSLQSLPIHPPPALGTQSLSVPCCPLHSPLSSSG